MLGLALTDKQKAVLVRYVVELHKWNQAYNLTAIRDTEGIMRRHVIDALSIVRYVRKYQPKNIADIGSGAGIPGVVLAIVLPETSLYLVESIGKKCRFLRYVTALLNLDHRVTIVQKRVEQWHPQELFSVITCRAFASLKDFVELTQHLGCRQTVWLAMKSAHTAKERIQLPNNFTLCQNIELDVPFEDAGRHLLILKMRTPI